MDEVHFLFDELEAKNMDGLREILGMLQHPSLQRDAYVLRRFARALLHASVHKVSPVVRPVLGPQMIIKHDRVQISRQPLMPSVLSEVHYESSVPKAPLPEPVILPRPIPVPEFPVFPVKDKFPEDHLPREYVVIADKLTKKPLVSVKVGDSYEMVEPELFVPDKKLLAIIMPEVRKNPKLAEHDELLVLLEKKAKKLGIPFVDELVVKIRYFVIRDVLRLGKVEPLLRDKKVEKVVCNGFKDPLQVVYNHKTLPTNVWFSSDAEVHDFVVELLRKTNQKVDGKQSFVDYTVGNLRLQLQLGTKFSSAAFTITKRS